MSQEFPTASLDILLKPKPNKAKQTKTTNKQTKLHHVRTPAVAGYALGLRFELFPFQWKGNKQFRSKMADKEHSDVSSQQNNPLSRKLNKILESRLDNDKVCENVYNTVVIWVGIHCEQCLKWAPKDWLVTKADDAGRCESNRSVLPRIFE